jgi:hypothetical protein
MKAGGMEKKLLGTRQRELRPDLVVGDDLEPGPADWTPASKAKTLGRLVNDVLPAGQWNTATVLVGTPVGMGSIMHDVVRAARGRPGALGDRGEWVRGNGFVPYWFPAIVDAGGPRQRSAWETRFPLEDLLEEQEADKRTFVLQMQCDPDDPAAQQWWTEDTFRYDSRFVSDHRILSIDGAVTRKATSDHSAVAVLAVSGSTPATMRVCVEHAESGHWSRTELKERAWALTAQYPRSLRTWLVDATGSGDHWLEALSPPPPGVEIVPFTTTADPKRHRIETLFDDYARGAVLHGRRLAGLEGQMVSWKPGKSGPAVDDLIDAVRAGKDFLLYGDASRKRAGGAPASGPWRGGGAVMAPRVRKGEPPNRCPCGAPAWEKYCSRTCSGHYTRGRRSPAAECRRCGNPMAGDNLYVSGEGRGRCRHCSLTADRVSRGGPVVEPDSPPAAPRRRPREVADLPRVAARQVEPVVVWRPPPPVVVERSARTKPRPSFGLSRRSA